MDSPATKPPRIWLVLGDKLGDNAQVQIIADALGLPYEVRRVLPKPEYVLGKPPFEASLYHLDLERSDRLEPPWPDLVLTVGRRASMAAMWIRQQSGGRAKVVLLGRPKRMFDEFALIIATGQYRVPERRNVLRVDLPLMRADPAALEQARGAWRARFAPLPRPLTAVLVGGPTKPYVFDAGVAQRLIEVARRSAGRGTLSVTTSRRTPEPVVEALQAALPAGGRFYRWTPEAVENPYLGLLALADRCVVTGDSISMMVEVARLGKPLAIFPLPTRAGALARLRRALQRAGLVSCSGTSPSCTGF